MVSSKVGLQTAPAFEDGGLVNGDPGGAAIVDVDLRSVVDGDLSGIGKLAATDDRLVGEARYDVYCVCRLA